MPVVPVVLVAAALHASWNALVKTVTDRLALMGVMGAASVVICVPAALIVVPPRARAWPEIAASMLLHTIYNLLLIETYREGDFNQVYPIARGVAPPAVAVASLIVVGETLSPVQTVGLIAVTAGLLAMAGDGQRPGSRRAIVFALLTGLVIAAYTVVDGVGVRHSGSVLGYGSWLFVGQGSLTLLAVLAIRARDEARGESGGPVPTGLVARGSVVAVMAVVAYGLVLWAQTHGDLAVVAALRETSVVFAALLGALVFREPMPLRRVVASAVIAAGAAGLALG
jgi:drug/metabolite transporter (DMT)-like permease